MKGLITLRVTPAKCLSAGVAHLEWSQTHNNIEMSKIFWKKCAAFRAYDWHIFYFGTVSDAHLWTFGLGTVSDAHLLTFGFRTVSDAHLLTFGLGTFGYLDWRPYLMLTFGHGPPLDIWIRDLWIFGLETVNQSIFPCILTGKKKRYFCSRTTKKTVYVSPGKLLFMLKCSPCV